MADDFASFCGLYGDTEDPYSAPGDMYDTYPGAPAANTPQSVLASVVSHAYPVLLLLSGSDHVPMVAVAPFSEDTLPGRPPSAAKYAFVGDITPDGTLPPTTTLTRAHFFQTGQVTVLPSADMEAAWAAAAADAQVLPTPAAGVATEQVQTRKAIPVPHRYAEAVLRAFTAGHLTWKWLWTNVGVPILADPGQAAPYAPLLDYLRVASIMRSPAAAGGADREPATELPITGALPPLGVQRKALKVAEGFLPGLRRPVGVTATLAQLANSTQQISQQVIQGQQERPKTMTAKHAVLWRQVMAIGEITSETDSPMYWADFASLKTPFYTSHFEGCVNMFAQSQDLPILPPIIRPGFVSDLAQGKFTGISPNDVSAGLSIFRVRPGNSPTRRATQDQNRVYNLVILGTGAAPTSAINMVLENKEIELPNTGEQFKAHIEGYYVVLVVVAERYNRAVVAYYDHVVRNITLIVTTIEQTYEDPAWRRGIYTIILSFIYRLFDDYFRQLLKAGPPAVRGVPAAGGPVAAPAFEKLSQELRMGRVEYLTVPPATLFEQQIPVENPSIGRPAVPTGGQPPAPPVGAGEGRGQGQGAGGTNQSPPGSQRAVVERRDQNQNLKRAWAATGHTSIYGEGSPFHDASQPNNKKVIPSDTPGVRICLPMALNGICYSNCRGKHDELIDAEVQRVAQAGNLQL